MRTKKVVVVGMATEVERELEELALQLEGLDRPQETYLEAAGRITSAWATAREVIAADTPPPGPVETAVPPYLEGTDPGWVPVVEDPQHPFWRSLREQEWHGR